MFHHITGTLLCKNIQAIFHMYIALQNVASVLWGKLGAHLARMSPHIGCDGFTGLRVVILDEHISLWLGLHSSERCVVDSVMRHSWEMPWYIHIGVLLLSIDDNTVHHFTILHQFVHQTIYWLDSFSTGFFFNNTIIPMNILSILFFALILLTHAEF